MHILVVEQDPKRERACTAALTAAGHRPEVVGAASAALVALARPTPPEVLLYSVQTSDMATLDFLQAASGMGPVPPIVLLGTDRTAADWIEAARLGVGDFVAIDDEGGWLRVLPGRLLAALERRAGRDQVEHMADALASTSAAVIIADRSGNIEVINEACAHLLGRSPGSAATGC